MTQPQRVVDRGGNVSAGYCIADAVQFEAGPVAWRLWLSGNKRVQIRNTVVGGMAAQFVIDRIQRHGPVLDDELVCRPRRRSAGRFVDEGRGQAVAVPGDTGQAVVEGHRHLKLVEPPFPHRALGVGKLRCQLAVDRHQGGLAAGRRGMFRAMRGGVAAGAVIDDYFVADDAPLRWSSRQLQSQHTLSDVQ